MSKAMTLETEVTSPEVGALLERVRASVREELRQGAEPADLSFVLAFVATELGLAIAPDPLQVFPVVLDAVTRATVHRVKASTEGEQDAVAPAAAALGAVKVH